MMHDTCNTCSSEFEEADVCLNSRRQYFLLHFAMRFLPHAFQTSFIPYFIYSLIHAFPAFTRNCAQVGGNPLLGGGGRDGHTKLLSKVTKLHEVSLESSKVGFGRIKVCFSHAKSV